MKKHIEIEKGQSTTFKFTVKNTGDGVLKIRNISGKTPGACDCKNIEEIENKMIPPGKYTQIKGEIQMPIRLGSFERHITVSSNDPDETTATLIFSYDVTTDVMVIPPQVYFGRVPCESFTSKFVKIEARTDPPMEIKDFKISGTELVTVKVGGKRIEMPGKADQKTTCPLTTIPVEVKLDPEGRIELVRGVAELFTNSEKYPKIEIPFYGKIDSDLIAKPSGIFFGAVNPVKAYSRTFKLQSRKKISFSVIDIKSDNQYITCREVETSESNTKLFRIDLSIPKNVTGNYRDFLTIKTDHPTEKSFRIPVKFRVRTENSKPEIP